MNDFIIAGITVSVIVIYVVILLFIAFKINDKTNIDPLITVYSHIPFTIICTLFVLGGIPYIITLWLIILGILLSYATYIEFKN